MRLSIILIALLSCLKVNAQNIPVYTADKLMERVSNNDTFYIVNFWATWCGPCVGELPEFAKMEQYYSGKPVKVLLVSMDFKEEYAKKVTAFIKKKKLQSEVVWLNETNANVFIPKIEPAWQGSIPATLMIYNKTSYRNFFEGTIKAERLEILTDKQLALEQ